MSHGRIKLWDCRFTPQEIMLRNKREGGSQATNYDPPSLLTYYPLSGKMIDHISLKSNYD